MISCRSLERISGSGKKNVEFPRIAFTGINIITLTSDSILLNQTLLVNDGRIAEFGNTNDLKVPNDYHLIKCDGKYLLPGLIDMHVHISDDGDMLKFLKYGVTTVRNMSDVPWWTKLMGFPDILKLKEKQNQCKVFGPDIYTFGYCLDGIPPVSPLNKKITDSISARNEVIKEKKKGYDFIKLYDKLSLNAYTAIINSAKKTNMPVGGHVPELVGLDRVLDDHVVSIEHMSGYIDNNTGDFKIPQNKFDYYLNKTKSSGVYNCPTIAVWDNIPPEKGFDALLKDPEFKYLKWHVKWLWKTSLSYYYKNTYPDKLNYSKHMLQISQEFANKLFQTGCPLLIGTDANVIGTYVGQSTIREIELFNKCGIPNFETLKSATIVAATALGLHNEIGTIEKGKRANFIILNENPLENMNGIRTLAYVYIKKFLFSKAYIDELVEQYY
jgi:imidazolonepropionase-like amidohydrolase